MNVYVTDWVNAERFVLAKNGDCDVVSIWDSNTHALEKSPWLHEIKGERLVLEFDDIEEPLPTMVPPSEEHVQAIIEFGWRYGETDFKRPVLIHCVAGISRSTAAAWTFMSAARPDAKCTTSLMWLLRAVYRANHPLRI